jgi:hypothetical protein
MPTLIRRSTAEGRFIDCREFQRIRASRLLNIICKNEAAMSLFLDYSRSTPLYRSLCEISVSEDGNLLERTNDRTAESQIEFLRWSLHLADPQVVLETGTNKGLFVYLLSLICKGVTVHTFDCEPKAARAVELINQSQIDVVAVFHPGDSRVTLKQFKEHVQFAWIDGGHATDIVLSDLIECYRLRVPFIAVDDVALSTVNNAIVYLLQHAPYTPLSNPFSQHDRRSAVLLRLNERL